jgi:1,4-dihydroxy-2-naphthoyl-CoA hydrolase
MHPVAETDNFVGLLGLELDEISPDRVTAHLDVRPELHQPFGILHGGVHCSIVETLASVAAAVWLGDDGHVVGVANQTDFLRAVRSGVLRAEALPVHRGRSQQLWSVQIRDADERLVAKGQLRLQNVRSTEDLGRSS